MFDSIKLGFWNIRGIVSRLHGPKISKLEVLDIKKQLLGCDIIGLVESKANDDEELLHLPGYIPKFFHKEKNLKAKSNSGGISILIKSDLFESIEFDKTSNHETVWLKLPKEKLTVSENNDCYICIVYNPAGQSKENKIIRQNIWEKFDKEMSNFRSKGEVIIMGDFNARTSNLNDFIVDDSDKYGIGELESGYQYISDENNARASRDKISNKDGQRLIDSCLANDCHILNGRIVGDLMGSFTSFQPKGNSIVDYMIASKNIFYNVEYFNVGDVNEYSDHVILTSKISCHLGSGISRPNISNIRRNRSKSFSNRSYKFIWSDSDEERFKDAFSVDLGKSDAKDFLECTNTDEINCDNLINDLNRVFYSAANKTLEKRKISFNDDVMKTDISKVNKKWYDNECKKLLRELKGIKNAYNRDQTNPYLRGKYFKAYKKYRNVVKSKKRSFTKNLLSKLDTEMNGKEFWRKFKSLKTESSTPVNNCMPKRIFHDHYESLFKNEEEKNNDTIVEQIRDLEKDMHCPSLDFEISEKEIEDAINSMKKGKAPGVDGVLPEMIISTKSYLIKFYVKLFNLVLQKEVYPQSWKIGEITSIFKNGGSKYNPNNYRGITITNILSKLFCTIMNSRLEQFATDRGLIPEEQVAFSRDKGTSDHIFTLHAVVNKYLLNNNENGFVYSCFVDFSKAFDRVPHDILFLKLLRLGINGKFYKILRSMYSNSVSKIKNDDNSNCFKIERGVHQGNVLSPLLFKLFLADLPDILRSVEGDPVKIGSKTLSSLLFADDLVILSRSSKGLQKYLDKLNEYCNNNRILVNIDKTKSITFNKRGRIIDIFKYRIGEYTIENVNKYKYLGLMIQANGKFREATLDLKARSLKATYSLRSIIPNECSIETQIKLYNSMIKPILLYGSEIWYPSLLINKTLDTAVDSYFNFDNIIELSHIRFMKKMLGVHLRASNLATLGELGEYPMYIDAMKRGIAFWIHVVQQPASSLVKNAYNELYNLDQKGIPNWITFIKKLLINSNNNRLKHLWDNQGMLSYSKYKIEKIKENIAQILKDQFRRKWFELVNQENAINQIKKNGDTEWTPSNRKEVNWVPKNKLRTYNKFKSEFEMEKYLKIKMNLNHRKALTRIRISAHDLHIERGRYLNLPPDSRKCPFCPKEIETEEHVLLYCHEYEKLRLTFNEKIKSKENLTLHKVMTFEDTSDIRSIAKFCCDIFKKRNDNISILNLRYPIYFLSVVFYFYFS